MTNASFPDATDYKQLLSFLLHEVRRIQQHLQGSATLISEAFRGSKIDVPKARSAAEKIVEETLVLHNWLSIADLHVDPTQFTREPIERVSLHRMFFKAQSQLAHRAGSKKCVIKIEGVGAFNIDAYRIVAILPYLLLDNALKYSPTGSPVYVSLSETSETEIVEVSSIGPRVSSDELVRLGEAGFRGELARQVTQVGNGQGLMLAKTICSLHGGDIEFASGESRYVVNDLPYSDFIVNLRLPRARA